MGKISGVLLGGISTLFFLSLASGQFVQPVFGLIPAVAFGGTSLAILLRGNRRNEQALPAPGAGRLDLLEDALASMQLDLDSAQTSLQRLTDERAFLERLLMERNIKTDETAVHTQSADNTEPT